MNSGSAASIDGAFYPNWLPTGVWQGRFSGNYGFDDELSSQGYEGYYWSSTAGGTVDAWFLDFYGGDVNPGTVNFKSVGYAVRCAI